MRFTVFTPTYNRAKTLARVLDSLKAQTLRDFEWLVVDDGSTDGTRELVEGWINDESVEFPIRYVWQENAHKKVAHNRAVSEARGELLLVFDSDDWCVSEALERFWHYWNSIPEAQRYGFVGVCGLCVDEAGAIIGDRFPAENYIDSDSLEIRYRYRVSGEKWGAMRTSILRAFPYREDIPGRVAPGTVWDAVARSYKTRFFNEALRIYSQDVSGVIPRKGEVVDAAKDALGALHQKKLVLENSDDYLRFAPQDFILEAARLTRYWLHSPKALRRKIGYWPQSGIGKLLAAASSPLGIGMWLIDRWRWALHRSAETRT